MTRDELYEQEIFEEFAATFPKRVAMAMQRARDNGIKVRYKKLSKHWICIVREADVEHINNLPEMIEQALMTKKSRDTLDA